MILNAGGLTLPILVLAQLENTIMKMYFFHLNININYKPRQEQQYYHLLVTLTFTVSLEITNPLLLILLVDYLERYSYTHSYFIQYCYTIFRCRCCNSSKT
jgi:hypothetical protein